MSYVIQRVIIQEVEKLTKNHSVVTKMQFQICKVKLRYCRRFDKEIREYCWLQGES